MQLNKNQRLETLKSIAEMLNQSYNKKEMLQDVLAKLIQVSHFEAGWIFMNGDDNLTLAADKGLPPALLRDHKKPMCGEDCYCVSKYKQGILNKATTIIECKRIELEIKAGREDTNGFTHHATVPLKTPEKSYGLLNVASPNRIKYEKEELDLLEAIAFQIGTALRRMEQFEKEELRVKLLQKLHSFIQEIRNPKQPAYYWIQAIHALKKLFKIEYAVVTLNQQIYGKKQMEKNLTEATFSFPNLEGKLHIYSKNSLSETEEEVLELAIQYMELTYKDFLLQERQKDMARLEERARLAQDLHDSVNQLLFSVVLTTKATKSHAKDEVLREQLSYIEEVSSQALKEMREMIADHKPHDLKQGILTGLTNYGKKLGLAVEGDSHGATTIPYVIEETLWRIGQEAIHNVKKHAKVDRIRLELVRKNGSVSLLIEDKGIGFDLEKLSGYPSFGLKGMKERAGIYGGTVLISSQKNHGTSIKIYIPFGGEKK